MTEGAVDDATRMAVELLSPLGPITVQQLFGTSGLYLEDRIFGLVHDGKIYFRTTEDTATRYEAYGSPPFVYHHSDGATTPMQYHEVPAAILENQDAACAWAYEAAAG